MGIFSGIYLEDVLEGDSSVVLELLFSLVWGPLKLGELLSLGADVTVAGTGILGPDKHSYPYLCCIYTISPMTNYYIRITDEVIS